MSKRAGGLTPREAEQLEIAMHVHLKVYAAAFNPNSKTNKDKPNTLNTIGLDLTDKQPVCRRNVNGATFDCDVNRECRAPLVNGV